MDKHRFQGIIVPIVNPCHEDDTLDLGALEENADRLLKTDIQGLYINGGTGDGANLTQEERLQTAEYLVTRCRRDDKTAIVHVGQTTQRQALSLARQARDLGADAVASIPPRKPWPQIVEYYQALADTGIPVFVYYIPGVTGIQAGMKELRQILSIPGVAGIKMSDWNVFLIRCVKLAFPEKIVFSGFDEMVIPGLLYGADGCIGTWMNLVPRLYTRVYALIKEGKIGDAQQIMNDFTAFLSIGWNYGILDTFEELMRAKGYAGRCFRHPSSWDPGKIDEKTLSDLLERLSKLEQIA